MKVFTNWMERVKISRGGRKGLPTEALKLQNTALEAKAPGFTTLPCAKAEAK